jgi:hypothetical protein
MPDDEPDSSALSPEEIGRRAALIARSLEGLRVSDARTILGFAGGYLPRPPDEGMVVQFPLLPAPDSPGNRLRDGSGNVVGIDGEA